MEVDLIRAGLPDREVLFRLLQYSLYEESAHDGNEIGGDGLFAYPWFDAYFTDPDREAYLFRFRNSRKLLGFAMVRPRGGARGHSVAEFMVLPRYRRQGVGLASALACFQTHRGVWEVSPSCGSAAARRFRERVIGACTGQSPRLENGAFVFSCPDEK